MATIKVFEGETVVKEIATDLSVDEVQARLEAQPYSFNVEVDGQPYTIEVLVHPSMRGMMDTIFAKARRKKAEEDEEVEQDVAEGADEEDERVRRLLEILEEEEPEEEEPEEEEEEETEEEEKTMKAIKELTKAVKELRSAISRLEKQREIKDDEVKKERRVPVVIKSWAPYERVQKFEEGKEMQRPEPIENAGEVSDFQRELLKRLSLL